ncbi:MBL fold metallo-hydrolase [Glaciecola sp. KUL10]|uniref:MBL fold metallo-hydrolase n=1 Tax=Glaciecola sp. (strain KUL10) TaxID=2161813 RepID=UPI000D78856B|nr:MBL fold metallo-hydrolase [Glaciecola sp. KUL10]GBL06047.1 Zn-dependent hydrolase [Glaciecola sp. KUL10]
MKKNVFAASLVALLFSYQTQAQSGFDDVTIESKSIAGSVHMLVGAGGNIGVSAGDDGILIVDDQYAPLAEKIAGALAGISEAKTRYVINTHYHGDHTGSNAFFHEHKDATIFAHENVRVRLASGKDADPAALPVVTYEQGVKFHFNGETIHVFHLPGGHTDGDSVVWFEQPDVLHTGDLYFKDMFPYVDLGAGGSVKGYIASVQTILDKIDDDTSIIPGHGSLASKADYQRFLDMIKETYAYVQAKKASGMSEDDIVAGGLDSKWDSWSWRFITTERWIRTLYK